MIQHSSSLAGGVEPHRRSWDIAQAVAGIDLRQYGEMAINLAKDGILDYLGVAVAGATDPLARSLSQTLSARGAHRATYIGLPNRGNWIDAALFNGFVSHVLDFDDMSDSIRGHPSGPVLSALLPLAEMRGATGGEVLTSYMVGVDGMALIGKDLATAVQHAGYHPTAVLGAVGSALACGKLLGLAVEELTTAMSMALAQAGGMEANFGTPGKPLQVGLAAAAGARAAQFANSRFQASPSPIESLVRTVGGLVGGLAVPAENIAAAKSAETSDWESQRVRFKRYPSCWLTHQAIAAGQSVRRRCDPSDIVEIDVRGSYRVERMLQYPVPQDRYQARFSLPYCLAIALLYDAPLLPHLATAELDQRALGLVHRIRFSVHPELTTPAAIDREFTVISVVLKSGERLEVRTDEKVAVTSRSELMDKVQACFAMSDMEASVPPLIRLVERFEQLSSVQPLMRLVRASPCRFESSEDPIAASLPRVRYE